MRHEQGHRNPRPPGRAPAEGSAAPPGDWLLRYSTLIVLAILFAAFSIFVDRYPDAVQTRETSLQQIAILGIVGGRG